MRTINEDKNIKIKEETLTEVGPAGEGEAMALGKGAQVRPHLVPRCIHQCQGRNARCTGKRDEHQIHLYIYVLMLLFSYNK